MKNIIKKLIVFNLLIGICLNICSCKIDNKKTITYTSENSYSKINK